MNKVILVIAVLLGSVINSFGAAGNVVTISPKSHQIEVYDSRVIIYHVSTGHPNQWAIASHSDWSRETVKSWLSMLMYARARGTLVDIHYDNDGSGKIYSVSLRDLY